MVGVSQRIQQLTPYLEKGKEFILITQGVKHLLHVLKPELVQEAAPQENVRNSYQLMFKLFE